MLPITDPMEKLFQQFNKFLDSAYVVLSASK